MPANAANILVALLLAGLLGTLGQGVRAVAGLKKMNADAAAQNLSATDVFMASRLIMSLLIGFMAGVAAGLALGLAKILAIGAADIDVLLGIAAAGYAGTDFVEAFAPTITGRAPLTSPKLQPAALAPAIPSPALVQTFATPATQTAPGMLNPKYGVTFGSLVPGGFFSGDPDDLNVHRSIRTNNPGALNFTSWQKAGWGMLGQLSLTIRPITTSRRFIARRNTGSRPGTTCWRCATIFPPAISRCTISRPATQAAAMRTRSTPTLPAGTGS